ncbi:uncharacterized protein MEPE_00819 [Melanopsichium pennsylvanicum]|uniref:DNA binding protein Ncp1 n=2 Tax=Melanopsichium pennsylvanicum TaxID=63383 RepID=A0AAJ4XH91_9BASI|nr:conserved hypothetical protein [Melanopsichium pennsylvanicum 4]SNX82113.1 uncharacterized protein MEPE_00819 [Melanopsichium pennsylvanicum]
MNSKQIKREEKIIAKEAKADDKQLRSAQKSFEKDKKKDAKLLKVKSKAESEHQKAIKKEHKLQAKLEKAQAKYNESVRTLEEKKMEVDNANKAIQDHKNKLQGTEKHLASAQHSKAAGDQERHRHKEALAAHHDAPTTTAHTTNTATTQPVSQLQNTSAPHAAAQPAGTTHQAPTVGAH